MNKFYPTRSILRAIAVSALFVGTPYWLSGISKVTAETQDVGMNCSEIKTFFRGLQLTSDQRTSLQTIATAHQTTLVADRLAVKTATSALKTFLNGGGSDAAQIDTLTSADAAALKILQTELSNIFVESYAVLTDAQKAQLVSNPSRIPGLLGGGHRHRH